MEVSPRWAWTCCNPSCSCAQTGMTGFVCCSVALAPACQQSLQAIVSRSCAATCVLCRGMVLPGFCSALGCALILMYLLLFVSAGAPASGTRNAANIQGPGGFTRSRPKTHLHVSHVPDRSRSPTPRGADVPLQNQLKTYQS